MFYLLNILSLFFVNNKFLTMCLRKLIPDRLIRFLILLIGVSLSAQDLYVGENGQFFMSAAASPTFTTSGTVVTHHLAGEFVVEAGSTWTESTEYVDGLISVVGSGSTVVNIGDTSQSTVAIATLSGDYIICDYTNSGPTVGTKDASIATYSISDAEFWTITKQSGTSADVSVSGLTNTATTYEGQPAADPNAAILVRRDNALSAWLPYSSNPGFGEFAYAAETTTMDTESYDFSLFSVYPNPLTSTHHQISFSLPYDFTSLSVSFFDVSGKLIYHREGISVSKGVNTIDKPILTQGVYLMQFAFDKGVTQSFKYLIFK